MIENRGHKVTCKKCGVKFYTLGKKFPKCPACHPELLPKGTVAMVKLRIRPGGYNNEEQGWTEGYATRGSSGAVYLNCEFTIIAGPFAKKKIYSLIGLKSPKGPFWGNKGRGQIKNILNSAHNLSLTDQSVEARALRKLKSLSELDGMEFVATFDVRPDSSGKPNNEFIDAVIDNSVSENDEIITQQSLSKYVESRLETHRDNTLDKPLWFHKI
tara:strand:- start:985 stop:1626 length:642 start_codon:yes stop_codon:yes gene_type:complete